MKMQIKMKTKMKKKMKKEGSALRRAWLTRCDKTRTHIHTYTHTHIHTYTHTHIHTYTHAQMMDNMLFGQK